MDSVAKSMAVMRALPSWSVVAEGRLRKPGLLLAVGLVGGMVAAALPALAASQTTPFPDGNALVPGGAEVPDFRLNFLLGDGSHRTGPAHLGDNLEIALTSPDNRIFRFLFSPRPQFGVALDPALGNRGYAGLTWTLFDSSTIFGSLGVAGSYDPGTGAGDPLHRSVGPSVMLHGAIELGYHFGDQHSLSLSLERGQAPELRLGAETSDNLRLRYGFKF